MIRSMTGYGKAEKQAATGKVTVEVRSVNHRYGEIYIKLPRPLLAFESSVKRVVGEVMKRGKIEVFVQYDVAAAAGMQLEPDLSLAKAYFTALEEVRASLCIPGPVPLSLVANQKDVLVARETQSAPENLEDELLGAVRAAIDSADGMRVREGAALIGDIRERRSLLEALIQKVAERTPAVVTEYAAKLKERVKQLVGEVQVDEARLAQEIALIADRGDITEELVRFRSHLQQFDHILQLGEPVGRKLDFLMQEFNREINTIGSKANDAEIATLVVQIKAELERIREQVQNIE